MKLIELQKKNSLTFLQCEMNYLLGMLCSITLKNYAFKSRIIICM